MSGSEHAYCSSCAWPYECAAQESCARRDRGEIRSVYLEGAPARPSTSLRMSGRMGVSPNWAEAFGAAHGLLGERRTLDAVYAIHFAPVQTARHKAPCGASASSGAVSSLDLAGADTRRTGAFRFDRGGPGSPRGSTSLTMRAEGSPERAPCEARSADTGAKQS